MQSGPTGKAKGGSLLYTRHTVQRLLAEKDAAIAAVQRELGQALGCLLAIQQGTTRYLEERSPGITSRPITPPEAVQAAHPTDP